MNDQSIIVSRRLIPAAPADVYAAFADPILLAQWWGPEGFTNTIHEFDLRKGGYWRLTMHGPEKGHYENESVFTEVVPGKRICWSRRSQPLFDMELEWEESAGGNTEFTFRMLFSDDAGAAKMRAFVVPKNEENFDRLERLLDRSRHIRQPLP